MTLPQLRINKKITVRESQPLEKYLQQVQSTSRLTIDEEVECAQLIRRGENAKQEFAQKKKELNRQIRALKKEDTPEAKKKIASVQRKLTTLRKKTEKTVQKGEEARDKLMLGNLRFVISVAKQYNHKIGLSLEDLTSEGNLGLQEATKRFDETRGLKFITYAVSWIRQRILQSGHEKGTLVRKPGSLNGLQQKVYKVQKLLTKRLERDPSPAEIAEEADVPVEVVFSIQETNIKPLSLDAPFKQGEESTLVEIFKNDLASKPEEGLLEQATRSELQSIIDKILDKREQKVIRDYFGIGKKDDFALTLEDIGKELDLTRERVRQIREQALQKLKKHFQEKMLNN